MKTLFAVFAAALLAAPFAVNAQGLAPEMKAKVDAQLKLFQPLGSDPVVVKAVKEYNLAPPAEAQGMTQEKWKGLTVISPEVRYFSKNALAEHLKGKRTPVVAELFVSGANGAKAAFFSKTTSWSHLGKPKHDQPMAGKTWIGPVELDESTGKQSVQVAFPVLDAGKPIGSVVVGLDVSKL